MPKECFLSTVDNEFDYFTQFDDWLQRDLELSRLYSRRTCCSMLALFANTSNDLSDLDNQLEIEAAIDRIVVNDPTNTWIKVTKS